MAFGLFRKQERPPAEAAASAQPAAHPAGDTPHHDSAREILELLELELGAMIRQLERAANSVASGAQ
jgi:methyl-accepting chemotaxis protein